MADERGSGTTSGTEVDGLDTVQLVRMFVTIADTIHDDEVGAPITELTSICVQRMGVSAAGSLFVDAAGDLQLLGESSESVGILEALQLHWGEGPCRDCLSSGATVSARDLTEAEGRWPRFVPVVCAAGFTSLQAVPLRSHEETHGVLSLFFTDVPVLDELHLRVVKALADLATVGVLQRRLLDGCALRATQLQHALDSRVVIEQAKGRLAQHLRQDVDTAFSVLRAYARNHNLQLTELASLLASGKLSPAVVVADRAGCSWSTNHGARS